jgi:hypothetical protein
VPSERCSIEEQSIEYIVDGRVMFSDFVCGDLRSPRTTRHNTLIHNILSTALQLSLSQKALVTLPDDGNVMLKYVGATVYN